MLGLTFERILVLLQHYGYAVIFPIATLEGPMVAVLAGFLVSIGRLNGLVVFIILMAGDITGDTIYYIMGRWGREKFIRRWGKFIGVTEERVLKLEKYFEAHDWKIIFFAKTQAVGSAILVSAGIANMPYGKYIGYNIIGSIPKVALFEFVGFHFGQGLLTSRNYLDYAGIVSFAIAAVLLGAYWFFKRYINSKTRELDS